MDKELKVFAKEPNPFQSNHYCMYCRLRKPLMYLYDKEDRLIGLGLDNWFYCPQCKRKYKKGIYGFTEQELDCEVAQQRSK